MKIEVSFRMTVSQVEEDEFSNEEELDYEDESPVNAGQSSDDMDDEEEIAA